jgi:SPP1 family predicted phage head-tail adaptor
MLKANVVTLIREEPYVGGVGLDPTETKRTVPCTVRSIGMQEAYQAMGIGLNPELKVILAHDFEYGGERKCEIGGQRYNVLRTYITETDGIELTLQRENGNAFPAPQPPDPPEGGGT